MDEAGPLWSKFLPKLANRLEERKPLDIADRATNLAKHEVYILARIRKDEILDGICDVRNDLDGRTEEIAAAFLLDDRLIDAAGGDVVRLARRDAGKPLVVTEVEIGFGAIVRDEDFAMLARRHRAGIDVQIRIELA